MRIGEKLICSVELTTVPVRSTGPKTTFCVIIEAESLKDAAVQAYRLALRVRLEAAELERSLWSVHLWDTPCHRVDVDGTLHRSSTDRLVLAWDTNAKTTMEGVLDEATEEAMAL